MTTVLHVYLYVNHQPSCCQGVRIASVLMTVLHVQEPSIQHWTLCQSYQNQNFPAADDSAACTWTILSTLNTDKAVRKRSLLTMTTTTTALHAHDRSTYHWTLAEVSDPSEAEYFWQRWRCCMYIKHQAITEHCQSCMKLYILRWRRQCT